MSSYRKYSSRVLLWRKLVGAILKQPAIIFQPDNSFYTLCAGLKLSSPPKPQGEGCSNDTFLILFDRGLFVGITRINFEMITNTARVWQTYLEWRLIQRYTMDMMTMYHVPTGSLYSSCKIWYLGDAKSLLSKFVDS